MGQNRSSFFIRPLEMDDASQLLDIVKRSSGGISSLQPRLDFLRDYISKSVASFDGQYQSDEPHKYLLGMFRLAGGELIGCAAVKTNIGTDSPFINFELEGDGADQYLMPSNRFSGMTEVGSLFLHPDYRKEGLGTYLAKMRYHLIASEPWRFGDTIIAELRGTCGVQGSPLYDYLFAEKLEKNFLEADAEYFDRNPDALGDIVPIGKIPTAEFPLEVKASLGQAHPSGKGALRLLQSEGFVFSGVIDLFDGGPIMVSHRDTIRTIMDSVPVSQLTGVDDDIVDLRAARSLISVGKVKDFRAIVTQAVISEDGVSLPESDLSILDVEKDTPIRVWTDPTQVNPTVNSLVSAQF